MLKFLFRLLILNHYFTIDENIDINCIGLGAFLEYILMSYTQNQKTRKQNNVKVFVSKNSPGPKQAKLRKVFVSATDHGSSAGY